MEEERHCTNCGGPLPTDAPQGLCPQCLMKLGLPSEDQTQNADASNKFVPPEPSELAGQFPQLEIIELLGQGGMGAVYKARQKQLDRLVALKILPPQVGQSEDFAERFTREARSLAKLNHPYIVTVHDFGHTESGLYYFIMEFVEGTDLRRIILGGKLSAKEALAIVPQICDALNYAHEEGVVHRDIKPENILLDNKGTVKIADFGLAKLLGQPANTFTLTQAGQKMGTPHYMAPEQIEHPGQVDHRADIYSLGVVFYEMLTGELPLGRFAPPSQKVAIDVRLDNVVLRSLEKEPERRYQHASEVKTDINIIASSDKPAQSTAEPSDVARVNPMEKHVLVVGGLRIAFSVIGLFIATVIFVAIVGGGRISEDPEAIRITSVVGPTIAFFFAILSVPGLIGGIWLIKRQGWARILVLILSILGLVNIPFGTIFGIYSLWVLLNKDTVKLFASS
jgi:predicted Ser/Thr protein kinase